MTSPMARLQQKKQAAVTTGSAGSPGIPRAVDFECGCGWWTAYCRFTRQLICPTEIRRSGRGPTAAPNFACLFVPHKNPQFGQAAVIFRGLQGFGVGVTHKRGPMYRTLLLAALAFLLIAPAQAESGLASYYGGRGHGMTCAHRTRPMGSMVTVRAGGRAIQCRVNDRGPFVRGRVIDLSVPAARALGMMRSGVIRVSVE